MQRSKFRALALAAVVSSMFALGSANAAPPLPPVPGAPQAVANDELVMVSDYELNRFLFQAPLKRIHFPTANEDGESPILTKPVYMSGNTQVLLQFKRGETKPIQMVAELADGRVFQIRLAPRPVPGDSHFISDGKAERTAKTQVDPDNPDAPVSPNMEDIATMKALASFGEPPSGFTPAPLPTTSRFDKFTVVPLSGWGDGDKQVFVFSVIAAPGETAAVAPPQFYRPGITAVMLDGDVVDEKNSPTLYVIEELKHE